MKRTGRPKKYFYFGLDAGNASIKIVGENFSERIPSYKTSHYLTDAIGSVQLNGVGFTVGRNALLGTKLFTRIVDDRYAKVNELESLYLGGLAHCLDCPSVMHNRLVVSSHAYSKLKDEIKSQLEKKEQQVTLAGQEITLTTEVLLVVPEGFGAVYEEKANLATLDFGNGTTVLTPYSKGKPGEPLIEYYGVQKLIYLIADEMKVVNGGYPGDVDDIRRALERGDLKVDDLNIREIYKKCLAAWWLEGLSTLCLKASRFVANGERVIALGGGVALPGFRKILEAKGFSPITERPEMVNAKGLYQLALKRGGLLA